MCDEFIDWVSRALKLSFIAAKIKDLSGFPSLSRKLSQFLSLIDYFSNEQIENLRKEIALWENRKEWEKLKERGDYLINNGDEEKAYSYYKKALEHGENPQLLNNIAITLLKMERYSEAIEYLNRALGMMPHDYKLLLHIAEAHLLNKDFDSVNKIIETIKLHYGEAGDVYYMYGELVFSSGRYFEAISYFERAVEAAETSTQRWEYMYRLCDVYLKLRFYDKALETLDKIACKDKYLLKKQAEVYVAYNNIPAAIRCIEKALMQDKNSVDLWTRLARYYRMDYDLTRANSAIIKALDLSPSNEKAGLENARIKKSMGRIKEYQVILKDVLGRFKEKYRENEI